MNWERNFAALNAYHAEHDNIDICADYVTDSGIRLDSWIRNLRTWHAGNIRTRYLSAARVEALDALGMIWDKVDYLFEKNYAAALVYYKKHGDLDIPGEYVCPETRLKLGGWIRTLRKKYRNDPTSVPTEQKQRLDAIGMEWDNKFSRQWNEGIREATAFFRQHGTISGMPADYAPDGIWVSKWINEQKHIYRGNRPGKSLTDEQIHLLEDIGIVWQNASESIWDEHYEDAKVFYEHNGHLRVLSDSNKQLYRWVIKQRGAFHKGKLRKSQVERLNDIGMEW